MERVYKGSHGKGLGGMVRAATAFFFCTGLSLYSQNLVNNGNFEAGGGSFEGWNISHTINQTNYAYSGPTLSGGGYQDPYYARFQFEQSGSGDVLSQEIATIPGELYDISFFAEDGAGHNFQTDFSFGNFTDNLQNTWILGGPNMYTGWTNFDFSVIATELETELSFLIFADSGSEFGADDISVVAVPRLQMCMAGGACHLSVTNTSGPVIIQATTNMINWVSVYTNTAPFTFTDSCKFRHCFYRAAIVSSGNGQ